MSDFGGLSDRRARPPRRAAVRGALIGLILFGGAAAWVWFAGHAAQPERLSTAAAPRSPERSETLLAAGAVPPAQVASGGVALRSGDAVSTPFSGLAGVGTTNSVAPGLPVASGAPATPAEHVAAVRIPAIVATTLLNPPKRPSAGPPQPATAAIDPVSHAPVAKLERSQPADANLTPVRPSSPFARSLGSPSAPSPVAPATVAPVTPTTEPAGSIALATPDRAIPTGTPAASAAAPFDIAPTMPPVTSGRFAANAAGRPSPSPTEPVRPSFDIARVTARGDAVLAGRAAPDALVTISAAGKTISEVRADAAGQWVALPSAALPAGPSELLLAARAPASDTAVPASASLLIVVPQPVAPIPAPANTSPATDAATTSPAPAEPSPRSTLALLLPRDGPPKLLQRPAAETATPSPPGKPIAPTLNLDQVDYATDGAIRFAGTAHPGASVRLYVDEVAVGETVADIAGRWAMEPAAAIAVGPHRVRVDELGIRGQVLARVALPFERSAIAPADVLAGRVVVQPRQTLWRIARRAYGHGVQYTVIYQANREQIADPDRIFPGQIFSIPGPPAK